VNCSLNTVAGLIASAIVLAYYWPTAYPLFAAAALVAVVSFRLDPSYQERSACLRHVQPAVRELLYFNGNQYTGPSCWHNLLRSFAVAGALQVAAIAALLIWGLRLLQR
jgi:hypothetical protein